MRLIASDLDGTLLGPDKELSAGTVEALRLIARRDVVVVAATGRSHRTAVGKVARAGVVTWAVCSNGATLYDLTQSRVDHMHTINDAVLDRAMNDLRTHLPGVGFGWESPWGFGLDAQFRALQPAVDEFGDTYRNPPMPSHPAEVIKVLVAHPDLVANELLDQVIPLLPAGVRAACSGAAFVEVSVAGVGKAATVAALCRRLGIDRADVVAFGDQHNDRDLLEWAGTGVAMGNAHPSVHAVADEVTDHHADDGVARYLFERLA
ncbi:MAG: Cof-type HAD-IIB family hydrolase [Acidimicrobiia bacterium]|nr:Cof-type HAD-IIB family hydrolase [Acidimicrobiia bacterium]